MYEQIGQSDRGGPAVSRKKDKRLWIALAACLAIFLVLLALILWGFRYKPSYQDYFGDFSNSVLYAKENRCMTVTTPEETYPILPKNIKKVYNAIAMAGPGRVRSRPEEVPEARLEFGNGTSLELWTAKIENGRNNREYGLLLSYTYADGRTYTYDTDRLSMSRLPLSKPVPASD